MKSQPARIQPRASVHELESRRGPSLGERVATFLRQQHPSKTADHVSARTRGRIPVATVKTWLQRNSAPDTQGSTELWLAYGPDFLAVLADGRAPDWLVTLRRDVEAAHLKSEIAALERKLAGVKP